MLKIFIILLINILVSILYPNDLFSINTSRPGTFNPTTTVQKNNYQFDFSIATVLNTFGECENCENDFLELGFSFLLS